MSSGGGKKRLTVYLEGARRLSVNGVSASGDMIPGRVSAT